MNVWPIAAGRFGHDLSTSLDRGWQRSEAMRTAARKALVELDAKERLSWAIRGRLCQQLGEHVF